MSRHGAVEFDWADGTHSFRLGLREIEELEAKRDCSLFMLLRRMDPRLPDARLADIIEVLRLGLIGGGMDPLTALALVKRYADERPIEENRDAAYAVLIAGMARVHGDKVEEQPPGEAERAEPNGSTSSASMETPQ